LENMDVRINKAGEQNHAVGVDFLKGLDIIRRIARPEPCYPVAPDGNRAMVDHAVTFIHRLDRGVSYDQIIGFHIITSIIRAEEEEYSHPRHAFTSPAARNHTSGCLVGVLPPHPFQHRNFASLLAQLLPQSKNG